MTQGRWSGQTGDLVASETRGRVGQRKGDSDMDGVGDRTERAKFWSGFSAAGAGLAVLGEAADAGRARLEAPRSTALRFCRSRPVSRYYSVSTICRQTHSWPSDRQTACPARVAVYGGSSSTTAAESHARQLQAELSSPLTDTPLAAAVCFCLILRSSELSTGSPVLADFRELRLFSSSATARDDPA